MLFRSSFQVRSRRRLLNFLACGYGPCEADFSNFHVAGDYSTSTAITRQNLEDTRREACFLDQRSQCECCKGRLFGWLENETVASSQRRSCFESACRQGAVPGNNAGCNTKRLMPGDLHKAIFLWVSFAAEFVDPTSIIFEGLG